MIDVASCTVVQAHMVLKEPEMHSDAAFNKHDESSSKRELFSRLPEPTSRTARGHIVEGAQSRLPKSTNACCIEALIDVLCARRPRRMQLKEQCHGLLHRRDLSHSTERSTGHVTLRPGPPPSRS